MSDTSDDVRDVLMSEDFSTWDTVTSSDFYAEDGAAKTNGRDDGALKFETVDLSGKSNVEISFNARIERGNFEEWGTQYGDVFRVEFVEPDGTVHVLDEFTGSGSTLVGSETGAALTNENMEFTYTLPEGITSGYLQFSSDISARGERISIDNVLMTASQWDAEGATMITFDTLGDGTQLSAGDGGTLVMDGVTFTATKKGATAADDAMIFDAANPTGGDSDLFNPAQGNVLIISEDHDSSDPDDNAQGGTIIATFDQPSTAVSIDMLDIEEPGATIDLLDAEGAVISTVFIPPGADGDVRTFGLGNVEDVSGLVINMPGSGAIDGLKFVAGEEEPGSVDAVDDEGFLTNLDLATPEGMNDGITLGVVYDNDSDPQEDDFIAFQVASGTVTDNTPDGDGFFGWIDATNGGQIRVNLDGTFQFRDPDEEILSALNAEPIIDTSITYSITDGTGATDTASVIVTIENLGLPD